ncbi:MAG: ornithine carbamoyltransferase [Candidatus Omnitrophica bacterium]|nr:ornithine carbamoyltransferase [Candidatus Omnitrophota bacterium]
MRPRHLLAVRDLTAEQIGRLFREAARWKRKPLQDRPLEGKMLGLLFQKPSVRTRVSFEVGMTHLGGGSLYIGPLELQNGKREEAKDVARVLSRYLDGIVARTFSHREVEELARSASIPVINGLSDRAHPCQALSDLFTIEERIGRLKGVRVAYVGDGNNVCNSLIEACALLGVHLSVAAPAGYEPDRDLVRWAKRQASASGGRLLITRDPKEAARGAAVLYTDVWTSMGQEQERSRRRRAFRRFQVNMGLMKEAGKGALFMHCLPAHRGEEVTDEVMDSRHSIVYDQAENRLHLQKGILVTLLSSSRKRGSKK